MGKATSNTAGNAPVFAETSSTTSVSSIAPTSGAEPRKRAVTVASFILPSVEESVIFKAVRNHLRYLRSIGRNHVTIAEIARALQLSAEEVQRAALKAGARLEP